MKGQGSKDRERDCIKLKTDPSLIYGGNSQHSSVAISSIRCAVSKLAWKCVPLLLPNSSRPPSIHASPTVHIPVDCLKTNDDGDDSRQTDGGRRLPMLSIRTYLVQHNGLLLIAGGLLFSPLIEIMYA